jgi:hypothetical protein
MTWRQDDITPAPYLVITGMTYLMPAWLAWKSGFYYSLASNLFLCATTMSFHWFRTQWIFSLDQLAIWNYTLCSLLNAYQGGPSALGMWTFSVGYSLYSYFVGRYLSILCWDPNWTTQMFFHGLIHMVTAYGVWYVLTKRNEKWIVVV